MAAVVCWEGKDVLAELNRRQGLKAEIEKFWETSKWGKPNFSLPGPMGILARQVATCRYEDLAFQELALSFGLVPQWWEYTQDLFSVQSPFKMSLLRFYIWHGKGKHGGDRLEKRLIADPSECHGLPLCTIKTTAGINLADFHHNLRSLVFPEYAGNFIEQSNWLKQIGGAEKYYLAFLSVFVAHGVLFEAFYEGESGKALDAFTQEIVEPAYSRVVELFGATPLVIKMPWEEKFGWYPGSISPFFSKRGR